MNSKKIKIINELIEQMIEKSVSEDRAASCKSGLAGPCGDSWMTYHLLVLKELLNEK
jgi:hypothetical protein